MYNNDDNDNNNGNNNSRGVWGASVNKSPRGSRLRDCPLITIIIVITLLLLL